MTDPLLKSYAIQIQQKLYEKEANEHHVAVYQTEPYGRMLAVNHQPILSERDSFFYHEMMVHPALFTHINPKSVAIIGQHYGILEEVLKHPDITRIVCIADNLLLDEAVKEYFSQYQQANHDKRVEFHSFNLKEWLSQNSAMTFDVVIKNQLPINISKQQDETYYQLVSEQGILIKPCPSSLLEIKLLDEFTAHSKQAGFNSIQFLNFPQPSYPSGWRILMMATKMSIFKRIREKDIYNRSFNTRYYNYDMHKAALALPEFVQISI